MFTKESGTILVDSHAEVLARRGFLQYLYAQVECALDQKPSVFLEQVNISFFSNYYKLILENLRGIKNC